jgi:hypothetical protein
MFCLTFITGMIFGIYAMGLATEYAERVARRQQQTGPGGSLQEGRGMYNV